MSLIQGYDAIDTKVLTTLDYEYPGRPTTIEYTTEEFTSICPWTGLPDFATLIIRYIPNSKLVELKSLKLYLSSYRNVGILQEHAVNRILDDLVSLLSPIEMSVEASFRPRGGITTKATATYNKK